MAAPGPKPTSIVLVALAVIFIIIMIILCSTISTPSTKPDHDMTYAKKTQTEHRSTTTAVPLATEDQTSTTAVPLATEVQTSTTAVPLATEDQTSTTAVPLATEDQTSTTAVPLTTENQTSTTAVPLATEDQTSTTAVPLATENQTSTTAVPLATEDQTSTTAVPLTTENQTSTTAVPLATEDQTSSTTVPPTIPTYQENTCNTPSCRRLASRMLTMMDLGDVNPCEDFYQYSCGGVMDNLFLQPADRKLLTNNRIRENLLKVDKSDTLLGPMRVYYDSCLNYTTANDEMVRRDQFQEEFQSLGYRFNPNILDGVPVISGHNTDFDLTRTLAKMMRKHFTPFFDLLLDVSDTDNSQFVFKLTPPLFQSPFTDDHAKAICQHKHNQLKQKAKLANEQINITTAYDNFSKCMKTGDGMKWRILGMEDIQNKMGLMDNMNNMTLQDVILTATSTNTDILLQDISTYLPDVATLRTMSLKKEYETATLNQLFSGSVFPSKVIDWRVLLETLLDHSVPEDFKVHIYFKKELGSILDLIMEEEEYNPINLQNMLLMLWSERLYMDLVEPFNAEISTPSYCYRATVKLMEDSASYLYLNTLHDRSSKSNQIKEMIKNNKRAATVMLNRHNSDITQDLLKKLEYLQGEVADHDEARMSLEENLKDLNLDGNFVKQSMKLLEHYRCLLYKNIFNQPSDNAAMWQQFLLPNSPSGVVIYALNKFLIPFGAMEMPLFYPDVPSYLNYAGIGHMVAHELMHIFDTTGLLYNETTKHTMNTPRDLVGMSECLAEPLDKYFDHNSGTNLNSTFTLNKDLKLNEVLADSGAARLAWEAYLLHIAPTTAPPTFTEEGLHSRSNIERRRRSLEDWYPTTDGKKRTKRQYSSSLFPPQQPPSFYPMPSMDTHEQRLPWLDLKPIQLYFLRIAQSQCSPVSELNMLTVMESSHLPPRMRVNYILKNEPLFAAAFACPKGSTMNPNNQCPYLLG